MLCQLIRGQIEWTKNCPPPASIAVPRECATGAYAMSAKARAIACLSAQVRRRYEKTGRSGGEDSGRACVDGDSISKAHCAKFHIC